MMIARAPSIAATVSDIQMPTCAIANAMTKGARAERTSFEAMVLPCSLPYPYDYRSEIKQIIAR